MRLVKESHSLSISSTVRDPLSFLQSADFFALKRAVLGDKYDLSLVFIGSCRSQSLNRRFRRKDRSTDILSFPIAANAGEIFIDIGTSRRKAKEFGRSQENFIVFLFIHGLMHLKGFDHGSRMESEEAKLRKKFHI